MGKGFKLRLSRVIPTFQSCRSKDPSDQPVTPLPAYFHVSPINPKFIEDFPVIRTFPIPQPSRSHKFSIKRHVSSAIESVGFGCRSKSGLRCLKSGDNTDSSKEFRWKKEEKWHVVARVMKEEETPRRKIYNSSVSGESDGDIPVTQLPERIMNKKKKKKKKQRNIKEKKKKSNKPRIRLSSTSSSIDSNGWFSSEGGDENEQDEETETLVSSTSRTISNDSSSEFDSRHLETIRESPINDSTRKKKKKKRVKKRGYGSKSTNYGDDEKMVTCPSPESDSPARLSVFQRLMPCKVEGKVKESFAVVKKSEDPYEDFRRSMMEMILEKQMFEANDLEQLLHCFLSLNSRHHHTIIVEAFSEIWELLFCQSLLIPKLIVSQTDDDDDGDE